MTRCTRRWPTNASSVLQAYDDNLALYNHKPGSLLALDTLLHERTGGYMDTRDQLICQTAQQAIEDGTEAITEEASTTWSWAARTARTTGGSAEEALGHLPDGCVPPHQA